MSYEFHKYYNENLYENIAKYVRNQQLFMDLHVGITMDVKNQPLLRYVGIAMDVKNQPLFMRPICRYYNGCKKTSHYL
jgi:hypothetical protein